MENCIFCKIVTGKIPAYTIYEDDNFISFLDIFPRAKGHALVIPKRHYRWVYDVPNFGEYWEAARKTSEKIQNVLHPDFISFVTFGLDVLHAHIHILPSPHSLDVGDVITMSREEIAELAEKIK